MVGFFTIALRLVRLAWNLLKNVFSLVLRLDNGLLSQFLGLGLIWLILPRLAVVIEKMLIAGRWLLHKFE